MVQETSCCIRPPTSQSCGSFSLTSHVNIGKIKNKTQSHLNVLVLPVYLTSALSQDDLAERQIREAGCFFLFLVCKKRKVINCVLNKMYFIRSLLFRGCWQMRRKHKNWADFKPVLNSPWRALLSFFPASQSATPALSTRSILEPTIKRNRRKSGNNKRKSVGRKEKKQKENQHNCLCA